MRFAHVSILSSARRTESAGRAGRGMAACRGGADGELGRRCPLGSLADLALGELADDVEVADVAGVLLQQVE